MGREQANQQAPEGAKRREQEPSLKKLLGRLAASNQLLAVA